MAKKRADRIRRRVTCELQLDGRSHRGIVLDLSETGVFVQTEATPPPGTRVRLRLRSPGGVEFVVEATVARRQVAPPQLASVVRGGLGLRVENPPAAYFKLIGLEAASGTGRDLGEAATGPASATGAPAAGAPPGGASGAFGTLGSAGASRVAPKAPAAPAPSPPQPDTRPEFRVRVKQSDGPRSRTLKVKAGSPSEARRNALAELGKGWEILSIEAA